MATATATPNATTAAAGTAGTTTTHGLQHTWVLWEHMPVERGASEQQWKDSMKQICEFSTVEEFWNHWAFVPRPSEIFSDGKTSKSVAGRTIDTFSIFKKGIKPEWEDPENAKGSELFIRKTLAPEMADWYWENLVLSVLGETLEEDDEVCGCRIVDKTKKTNKDSRLLYRLELWLRTKDQGVQERIKVRMADLMTDGKPKHVLEHICATNHK